jgi:hypothetical protein
MDELSQRLQQEVNTPAKEEKLCQGTLLSPLHYEIDVEQWGYQDARLSPKGGMTAAELSEWTAHLKSAKGE